MNYFRSVLLALIATLFSTNSCHKLHEDENHHFRIHFENCWKAPLFIWYDIDWHWYDNPWEQYDSFIEKPIHESERWHRLQPGDIDSDLMEHNEYYECALQRGDSVVISVFSAEHPELKDSECFLVRYHLSKEDLQKVNFHVSYPPTENMRDCYMQPSFDEVIEQNRNVDYHKEQ